MSRVTTNLGPIVSLTTTKSKTDAPHLYLDSNTTFTSAGPAVITGAATLSGGATLSGTNTISGLATLSGGVNVTSQATFASNIKIGTSGVNLAGLYSSTVSVNLPSVPPADSVSTTATINALTADAVILALQPPSTWSGAYFDLSLHAQVSAASTLQIAAANSTATAVDAADTAMTVIWIDPA